MAEKSQYTEQDKTYIYDNFAQTSRVFGIRKRKLFEAAVAGLITLYIVTSIPFVKRVQIIVLVVSLALVFFIFIMGIKDRSITEWIIAYIKFKVGGKIVSLRSAKYEKATNRETRDSEGRRLSYAQQAIIYAKKWAEENSKEGRPLYKVAQKLREIRIILKL